MLVLAAAQGVSNRATADLVVECSFRSHFQIPCATQAYTALLEHVPQVFVGTLQRMLPIVDILTRELSKSFNEMGVCFCASPCTALRASSILVVHEGTCIPRVGTLDCMLRVRARTFLLPACSLRHIAVQVAMPPWRSARSVMSKWAPQKAADHRPSTAASPPRLALPIKCAQRAPVLDSSLADIGALPAPRTSRDKGTWRSPAQQAFKRRSGGGSPVQSVKLGFACAPQHEPSVGIHAAVPAV